MPRVGETRAGDGRAVMPAAGGGESAQPLGGGRLTGPPASPKSTYRKSNPPGTPLDRLKDRFREHYYLSDPDVVDVVLGVVAGNHFDSDPVWLHLISPPSSGKTELLYSLFGCDEVYFLSDFTANALISGFRDEEPRRPAPVKRPVSDAANEGEPEEGESQAAEDGDDPEDAQAELSPPKDYSLLPKLDGKVVVTKDFSVLHDKPAEARAQILSVLRDVYDGYASRALGNSDVKGYKARFNYLTGMTPDIEKSWSLNTLGERFLMYRIRIDDRRDHCRQALRNVLKPEGLSGIRGELQAAVKDFLAGLPRTEPAVADDMVNRIIDLADVLSTCRTYVHRERNDDIPCLPQAELASRVGKQLLRVGRSVAMIRGRALVTEAEFAVMKRIALDSLPTNRRYLLAALWELRSEPRPLDEFARRVPLIASTTVRRELDNLGALGTVVSEKRQVATQSGKTKADGMVKVVKTAKVHYRLSPDFLGTCERVGGILSPRDLR
jgi:hypothetical protein